MRGCTRWRARPRCVSERISFFVGRGTGAPPASTTASAARRGGRQSNQRRLPVEIALRTLGGTRRVDVCVAAPAGARDLDVCVGTYFVRLTVEIVLRTLGGTRRVDLCVRCTRRRARPRCVWERISCLVVRGAGDRRRHHVLQR